MDWKLIETDRPPHGEPVLLFWPDWQDGSPCMEARPYSTGERLKNGYSNYSEHGSATHWMPLPAPPESAQ